MAGRRQADGKPRPPRFGWTRSNAHKVVACLDYSLEHKVDLETTAIDHIARRIGKEVTAQQIRNGLKHEWNTYGRETGDVDLETFLSEGSSFLVGYSDDDRETIRQEINQIEPPSRRYWLRNTPLGSVSRTRTLSPNRCQRSDTSTLSLHATPEFEGLGECLGQVNEAEQKTDADQVCLDPVHSPYGAARELIPSRKAREDAKG